MIPSEDVAVAVFGLLSGLTAGSPAPVVTLSRSIVPASQMEAGKLPAVFQVQTGWHPKPMPRTLGNVIVRVFEFEWFLYVAASPVANGPASSTALNALVDACIHCVPHGEYPQATNPVPFTVDTVPCNIYVEPEVAYAEAVKGILDVSIARIAVRVEVPPAYPVTP